MTSEHIEAAVRVRPFNQRELRYRSNAIVAVDGLRVSVQHPKRSDEKPRVFALDHALSSAASPDDVAHADQHDVFERIGQPLVDAATSGFNVCALAFGQSGSGKTYTMLGAPANRGLVPRILSGILDAVGWDVTLSKFECSFIEIYNESVRDLLNAQAPEKTIKVRHHPKLGVHLEGLTRIEVAAPEEVDKLLAEGAAIRAVAATQLNAHSSRSHALVMANVHLNRDGSDLFSRVILADLAGSERTSGTCSDLVAGEAASITKSLAALTACITRLSEIADGGDSTPLPVRDSQLTWLLHDALGGNSRTTIVATVSPADICFAETLSTLRFAEVARRVPLTTATNEDPQQRLIRELRAEIEGLKAKLKAIEQGDAPRGGPSKAELLQQLVDSTELFQDVTESPEERQARQRALQLQRQKGLAKLRQANRIPMDTTVPRLHTLNEDLGKLPGIAAVYPVRDGRTTLGAGDSATHTLRLKSTTDIAAQHCVLECASLRHSVTIAPCEDEDGLDSAVFVNGRPLRGAVELRHLDRVIVGPLAFRFVIPTSWLNVAAGAFSREAASPAHRAAIEQYDRLADDMKRFEDLCNSVGEAEAARAIPGGADLRSQLGELEARLAALYPLDDAPPVDEVERVMRYDFKYAMQERERAKQEHLAQQQPRGGGSLDDLLGDATPTAAAPTVHADPGGPNSDLDLETEGECGDPSDHAGGKALVSLDQVAGADKAGAAAELAGDDFADLLMAPDIDPNDIISTSPDASAAALALRAQLAKELLDYEDAMKRARVWKPNGPRDDRPQDQPRYADLINRKNIGYSHIAKDLGPPAHTGRIYKLRIKKSLFHRGGFHPVKAVVQGRFLYYFVENAADADDALGGCYLYGASVRVTPDIGEMKHCITISPSAPRKANKASKMPTEENDLLLGFDTEPDMLEWLRKLRLAAQPDISEELAHFFGDDVAVEHPDDATKPPRLATTIQHDELVKETDDDKAAVEGYKASLAAARPVLTAPKIQPKLAISPPVRVVVDTETAEIGDDWELLAEEEYTDEAPEEMRKYKIPLRLVHNFRFLKAYFRTSLEGDEKKKMRQKNRMWLVDHFSRSIQLVDIKNQIAHVFTARQLLMVEKDPAEHTRIKLTFFLQGYHTYSEFCVSMEDRERFYETASAIRPTVRSYCPPLVVGPPGMYAQTTTPIDGLGHEAQTATTHDPTTGASATMTLSGECLLRVSRVPTEPAYFWAGTINLSGIPLQSPELLAKWIPKNRFDVYVIAVQEASYRRNQPQFFEFVARYFGSDYLTVASVGLYDVLLVVVARRRHFMKITNVETSSCPTSIEALCGERGGVGIAFQFLRTSFCFVVVHLPGNAGRQDLRRFLLHEVLCGLSLGERDSDVCNQFDHLVLLGDFNYPALKGASLDGIQTAIEMDVMPQYVAKYDSLITDITKARILHGFSEPEIKFPPTYCVEVGTARYNTSRTAIPTFRSRILLKSASHGPVEDESDLANALQCTSYQCGRSLTVSEHLPVHATFVAHCLRPAATCFMPSVIPSLVITFEVVTIHRANITCAAPSVKVVCPLFETFVAGSDMCAVTPHVFEWNEGERAELVTTSLESIDNCFIRIILFDAADADNARRHKGTACFSLKDAIDRDNEGLVQNRRGALQRGGRYVADVDLNFRWAPM